MTVEESIHVIFYETNHAEKEYQRNLAEEDEQITTLKNLENCPKK